MAEINAPELHHTEAPPWAASTNRVAVFSVVRPNPDYVPEYVRKVGLDETYGVPEFVTKTFTMPAKPNPGIALDYLRKARENADVAAAWLLELAIGSDGYDALVEELSAEPDADIATATMQNIIKSVAQRALGGLGKA